MNTFNQYVIFTILPIIAGLLWLVAAAILINNGFDFITDYAIPFLMDERALTFRFVKVKTLIFQIFICIAIFLWPLYLEVVTFQYVVLSPKGKYLYMVEPNLTGFQTQSKWNSHTANNQKIFRVNDLGAKGYVSRLATMLVGTNKSKTTVVISYKDVSENLTQEDLVNRAKAVFRIKEQGELGRNHSYLDLIVLHEIEVTTAREEISKISFARFTNTPVILSEKVSLLSTLAEANEKLREGYKLEIVDAWLKNDSE